jgi:signal peptidase II
MMTRPALLQTKCAAIVLAIFAALADQLSKRYILDIAHDKQLGEGLLEPITSFFNLVLVYNHGISFGLFNKASVEAQPFIFLGIAVIISIILLVWLFRTRSALTSVALCLVVSGAIGNSIDRMLHGAVIDFLDIYAIFNGAAYHWPAFNVADSAIVCGVGLLLIDSLAFDKKTLQK